jgi:flagellar biosynthetic protein FliP
MIRRPARHHAPGCAAALLAGLCLILLATPAYAQQQKQNATANTDAVLDVTNPVSVIENATRGLDTWTRGMRQPEPAAEQPAADGGLSASLSVLMLVTVLTLAPSLVIMCTSFTRIVIVLALLRQAIGTQSLPPGQVIVGLALFLTLLIMAPTFERLNAEAIGPLQRGEINQFTAWQRARQPLRDFMFAQIDHAGNHADIYMILNYRGIDTTQPDQLTRQDVDMLALVPAFMLSELKVAFLMGFRLYLPFLIIDMVVASVLISMGMLMLPPVLISLPFKLLLFVLVDGWRLVTGNLLNSFSLVTGNR